MLRIALCDPNIEYQKATVDIWSRALFDFDDTSFVSYTEGAELIRDVQEGRFFADLLIMDLLLPDVSGLQLMKYIREHSDVPIILQSEAENLAKYGYRYHVFDFITKHSSLQEVEKVINRYLEEERAEDEDILQVSVQGGIQMLHLSWISYFVSEGRKIRAFGISDPVEFYMKLDELEALLESKKFLRCHQSYMVNVRRIQGFHTGELLLDNQLSVPVSRRYQKDVREYLSSISGPL